MFWDVILNMKWNEKEYYISRNIQEEENEL